MDVGALGGANQTRKAAARTATAPREAVSPFDRVTVGGGGEVSAPTASMLAAPPQEKPRRHPMLHGMYVAVMVSATLLGTAGCASMVGNGPHSAYALAQNVTGHEAHEGYNSIAFLDKVATPYGGGLFSDKSANAKSHLAPMDALDRMLDGQNLFYMDKTGGKPQQIHSWAELKGLEQMTRDSLGLANTSAP